MVAKHVAVLPTSLCNSIHHRCWFSSSKCGMWCLSCSIKCAWYESSCTRILSICHVQGSQGTKDGRNPEDDAKKGFRTPVPAYAAVVMEPQLLLPRDLEKLVTIYLRETSTHFLLDKPPLCVNAVCFCKRTDRLRNISVSHTLLRMMKYYSIHLDAVNQ